jgi:dipeptidyl aminopeptidase/acylaminoacyl peptidase
MKRNALLSLSFISVATIFFACRGAAQSVPDKFALALLAPDMISKPDLKILLTPDKWGAQISPDNKRLVFTRSFSGTNEVWISDIDGTNLLQLTALGGPHAGSPRWAPDGKWIAFDADAATRGKVFIVSINGGPAREIAPDRDSQNLVPNWSRDGKWVYFASDRSGEWQVWKAPLAGGGSVQVTHRGGFFATESPDGAYVYYSKHRYPSPGIWRVSGLEDTEEAVSPLIRPNTWADWSLEAAGIYFVVRDKEAKTLLQYFDFDSNSIQTVAQLANPSFFLSVSNDALLAVCASKN